MIVLKLAIFTFACTLVGCANEVDDEVDTGNELRLPNTEIPVAYHLRFDINLDGDNSTFTGIAQIIVLPTVTLDVITLNLKDLFVTNVTITRPDDVMQKHLIIERYEYLTEKEQFKIRLENLVIAYRKYLVTISYKGKLRTDATGLFVDSYKEDNITKWLAVTQFQPTWARRAFPCYDEPMYKTVFDMTIVKQKNQTALSNMPIERIETGSDGTEVVYFKSTPPMSTYLVAIFVGEFVGNKQNSNMTIYTHKDYIDQTKYIEVEAPKYLSVMEEYTDASPMLAKIDLLLTPTFYNSVAMENWGLNTFLDRTLLIDDESTTAMKIEALKLVHHEFAHQWFGNLVTLSWWEYTWLNEGFATYFEYFGAKMMYADWPLEDIFIVDMHQCQLSNGNPINQPIRYAMDIELAFNSATYEKAASVLRMLKHLVTEKLFRKSIQLYLSHWKERAVVPSDLFECFDSVLADNGYKFENGITIKEIMLQWTSQSGILVLNVTKNANSNKLTVIQEIICNHEFDTDDFNSTRYVGITYTTEATKNFNDTKPSVWTNTSSLSTEIPISQNSGWYMLNIQATGFYRVNYDIDNWMALIKQLTEAPDEIHVFNRAQLINDAFSLAEYGHINYSVPLALITYLENENNTMPWYSAKNALSKLIGNGTSVLAEHLKPYVSKLAGTIYRKLENLVFDNNTQVSVLKAWDDFSTWACMLNDEYCKSKALEYFRKWNSGEKIPADIKNAAFCMGVKYSIGSGVFYRMLNIYKTTKSNSEKKFAEFALGCSTNKTLLVEYVNCILDGLDRHNDFFYIISAVGSTQLGLEVLAQFLSDNIIRISNTLPNGESVIYEIKSLFEPENFNHSGDIIKWIKKNNELKAISVKTESTESITVSPSILSVPSTATLNVKYENFFFVFTVFIILYTNYIV